MFDSDIGLSLWNLIIFFLSILKKKMAGRQKRLLYPLRILIWYFKGVIILLFGMMENFGICMEMSSDNRH